MKEASLSPYEQANSEMFIQIVLPFNERFKFHLEKSSKWKAALRSKGWSPPSRIFRADPNLRNKMFSLVTFYSNLDFYYHYYYKIL